MKRFFALALVCMLSLSSVAFAADFKDMPNDWSTAALTAAVENGLLSGSDGYIKPSDNMTRAEMATIMVRACGATEEADISSFTDLDADDWYYSAMAKAVKMGAFNGSDNKLNPDAPITRQEAFVVLSRVFCLGSIKVDTTILDTFKDGGQVADWAKEGVAAIIRSGYVGGNEGYLNPLSNITRAEFAVVMDRMIKYYIDDASTPIPTDGNVMIRTAEASLDGLTTDKMIVMGDGLGEIDYSIKDANITGKIVFRCGKTIKIDGFFEDFCVLKPDITVEGLFTKDNVVNFYGTNTTLKNPIMVVPSL